MIDTLKQVKGDMAEALTLSCQLAGPLVKSQWTVADAGCYDGDKRFLLRSVTAPLAATDFYFMRKRCDYGRGNYKANTN
ncbi:hypothetical protein Llac01_08330 [Leuconostoc lactis]|nr:hypothetical protein LLA04_10680 [Leuconostoc lactis]GLY45456.1 hypothetical protein Llac01_08330 [Leuconostoc lactis]